MPALPAGLSSSRRNTEVHAAHGVDHQIRGISGSAHIHAMITVSQPVGARSMMYGAAIAPRMPPTPAAVETRPICAAG
jgi:hypothetical protein